MTPFSAADGAAGCSASLPQVSAGFRQRSAGLPQRSAISVGYSAELLVDRARWDPRLKPCLRAKMNENGNWGYDFRFHRPELKAPVRVTAHPAHSCGCSAGLPQRSAGFPQGFPQPSARSAGLLRSPAAPSVTGGHCPTQRGGGGGHLQINIATADLPRRSMYCDVANPGISSPPPPIKEYLRRTLPSAPAPQCL